LQGRLIELSKANTTQDVLYEVMTLMVKKGPLSFRAAREQEERLELKA
jgi:hypothetical protein